MKVILIVEDEFINYLLLKGYFSGLPIVTILAKNGVEAVEYVRTNQDINLVLMDLRMPEMDGFYATTLIKTLRPELTIIAQTAHVYNDIDNDILNKGFSGYLKKPFSRNELIDAIKPFLELE